MNIKDLEQRPLPPKYLDETEETINMQWLYTVISSYEEHSTVGALLERLTLGSKESKTLREVYLEEAAINIFSYAGATVVQADFTPDKKPVFTHATNLCKEWINYTPQIGKDKEVVILSLLPLIFEAQLTIVLSDLIYYDSQFNGGNLRLIMVFNENATQVLKNDDIDFETLALEAEREVNSEIKKIDEENFALQKEIEEMEKTHIFEDQIKENMKDIIDPTERILEEKAKKTSERESNPFMRIRKDENGDE